MSSAVELSGAFELSRARPGDRYFDYCLQPYNPRRPPSGKLRSENLLWKSLELGGALEVARPPLRALQESLGRDMTVFGVKYDGSRLWWELYLYDPRKEDPRATVTGLSETLAPWLRFPSPTRETVPYMMVSFDVDEGTLARGALDAFNLYLTGTDEHAGRSYKVTAEKTELENTYVFLPPKAEIDRVLSLLTSSIFIDYSDPKVLAAVLVPELFACKRVCVSKKRDKDAIYYSGIHVEQLLWFLKRFEYPADLIDFTTSLGDRLDHLFFDVGIDVRQDSEGRLVYPKTSFYGTL